jgi:hypothetical protein
MVLTQPHVNGSAILGDMFATPCIRRERRFLASSSSFWDVYLIDDWDVDAGDPICTYHAYTREDGRGVRPQALCPNGSIVDQFLPKPQEAVKLRAMYDKHKGASERRFELDSVEIRRLIFRFGLCESSLLFVTIFVSLVLQRIAVISTIRPTYLITTLLYYSSVTITTLAAQYTIIP